MIDVAQYEKAIAELPGDRISLARTQLAELLAEVKAGQAARRVLVNVRTMASIGLTGPGAAA